MIVLKIYLLISFLWALFAFYKARTNFKAPLNNYNTCLITALINFVLFPCAIYISVRNDKINFE